MSLDGRHLLAQLPRLRRYAWALLGDGAAADDLVQDTLERAWSRQGQWQPGSDLRAWLFGIMHNLRLDQLRQAGQAHLSLDDGDWVLPERCTQSDGLELRDLDRHLARLPEPQRQILLLVAVEEMSYEEIARVLEIPLGTVMSRLSRGRERLRQLLAGEPMTNGLRVVG